MGTLGRDPEDSLAITLALASPELTVRAITCVQGNVPVRHSYANAAHLLTLLGRADVPVAAGHERPLLATGRREPLRWLAESDDHGASHPGSAAPLRGAARCRGHPAGGARSATASRSSRSGR